MEIKLCFKIAIASMLIYGCSHTSNLKDLNIIDMNSSGRDNRELAGSASIAANNYLKLSDNISTAQDVATVALIGATAWGAYGVIDGYSASRLSKIALGGFIFDRTINYFSPKSDSEYLLLASVRANCIGGVALKFPTYKSNSEQYYEIWTALIRNSIILRRNMANVPIDYNALIDAAIDASKAFDDSQAAQAVATAIESAPVNPNADLIAIKKLVSDCLRVNLT